MAKRKKLYGAAAAAVARKRARSSTALARRSASAPAVRYKTRTRTVVVRSKRRRSGGGGRGVISSLKGKAPELIASAVYGFATRGAAPGGGGGMTSQIATSSPLQLQLRALIQKIPVLSAIGIPASHGLLATIIACNTSGRISQIADLAATAALHRASYNLGASNFDRESFARLGGDDDDGDNVMMGGIDAGDIADADYES